MTGDDKLRPRGREQYPSPGDVAAWTEIAADPHASPGDLMRCLAHDMPESVRFAAVSNPSHDGVAARMASGDPSPAVRAAVMLSPWIDEEARTALMSDPDVMDAAARMTGDGEGLQARHFSQESSGYPARAALSAVWSGCSGSPRPATDERAVP